MNDSSTLLIAILIIAIVLACVFGWVMNIVKLVEMDASSHTGLLAVRIIGIVVPPVGVVAGCISNP